MQSYVLGIDIGTGSTKAVAIGFSGQPLATSQHYYPVNSPAPGYAEQDAGLILQAFKSCIADVSAKLGSPAAISFSSAMHSVLPVDEKGNALAEMMIWADARSQGIADRLRQSGQGTLIYRASGTPIHAMTPLCKLIWWRENKPELFDQAYKFISIKEYIWYHLFNAFEVDYSLASASGLFDIKTLDWNPDACKVAGITSSKLSKPVNTGYYRNDLTLNAADDLNLAGTVQFVIGSSDGCCANLGSYVNSPDVASLTIGTSGAIRVTSPKALINDEAMIFNYLIDAETFVCGGAVNNGGSALQWLISTFLNCQRPGHKDYDQFFAEAQTVTAGSERLLFLPYINGERAPLWDTRAAGVFFNMRQHHTRAHFLRSGLEGICYALNDVLHVLEETSVHIKQIHISGGFISSPLWTRILADITGKPLIIIQQEDASALGAVFLAARALQLPHSIMQQPEADSVIKPDMKAHQAYTKQFNTYKKLYSALKELMLDVSDE